MEASSPVGRRRWRWVLLVVLLLLAGWAAWTASALLSARTDLRAAQQELESARAQADGPSLVELVDVVETARSRASAADEALSAPGPRWAARVPIIGRSVEGPAAVAGAVDAVLATAGEALPQLVAVEAQGGRVDLDALERLETALLAGASRSAAPLRRLEAVELSLTPGAVRRPVQQAQRLLEGRSRDMEDAGGATGALAGLLGSDGPRNLVLAVMNNAELRGAGGYASSFTRITTDDGRLTVEAFQDVNDVFDPPGSTVQVPAPPEFRERYGRYLADTTLWKNSLMSAHVPYSAAVVCQVARVNPGLPCDGVVLIDVPTLAALTTVQGPVQLADGEEVAGEALVDALLVVAYAEVDQTPGGDPGRRAALRAAADRGLVQLLGSEVGGPEVVQVLLAAVRGRHMALWSDDVQEQAALEAAGLAGSADPEGGDVNLVAMNQFSISKLDHYVDRRIEVDVVVGLQTALVTQRVTLALDAPEDLPQVVRGKGRLTGDLDIATALDAELLSVELDGAPTRFRRAVEAGSTRVSVAPDVPDGGSSTWTVQYTVPLTDGRYRLELLPQPLSRDADLRLSVAPAEGLVLTGVRGDLEVAGPFDVARTVEVQATVEQPSWWDRPVTLG